MGIASDRELLELIAAQVGKLTNELSEFKKETSESFSKVINRLESIDKRIVLQIK